jgi:hypothetical protein
MADIVGWIAESAENCGGDLYLRCIR